MGRAEGSVEDYLVRRVNETGGHQRKLQWIARAGAPDRLVWWHFPLVAFVELKAPKGRYEHSQKRELPRLVEAGWPVYVCHTREAVEAFIQSMLAKGCDIL